MESKDLVAVFEEHLQRFLASVVLIEPEDPGSYKDALFLLDELHAHTYARENPKVNDFLNETQRTIEACLLDSSLYPEYIKKLEEKFGHIDIFTAPHLIDRTVLLFCHILCGSITCNCSGFTGRFKFFPIGQGFFTVV